MYLLAPENAPLLARLATSRALLAFDFDGTLAPIVADRERATMRARTRDLLAEVARLYPCAVVSGRAKRDVAARLDNIPIQHVVGNHGIECDDAVMGSPEDLGPVRIAIARALAGHDGIELEDKRYSLSIHYRSAPHPRIARRVIDRIVSTINDTRIHPVRTVAGKLVTNVLPPGAPNKGIVVQELRTRERAEVTMYVGDDVTDEDVFQLDAEDVVGTRVGKTAASAAQFYLREQREIDSLLARLAELRARQ